LEVNGREDGVRLLAFRHGGCVKMQTCTKSVKKDF
jgi:hypothetical protein